MLREPTWTEVDGVPVVWNDVPGPLRAGLHFRVGVANETARTHGVTHLVEHLALFGMHSRPYPLNGMTGLMRTTFLAAGSPEEVAEFLASVSDALRALPAHRVAVERGVLLAEGDSRSRSYRDGLLLWRYGARGHGLAGIAEYGLRWLDADTVQSWADERFTRQNALLVLTGPPPAGLRLPLADGPVNAPVVAEAVETVIPGWSASNSAGIGAAGVVPREKGAALAASVLGEELTRVLRFERGLTYSVEGVYEPLDAARAHLTVSADAAEASHAALRDGFVEVLERLVVEGPDEAAMARLRDLAARVEDDQVVGGHLESVASAFATGREYPSVHESTEIVRTATPEDLTDSLRAFAGSALFVVPNGQDLPEPRYPRLPWWSPSAVEGVTFTAAEGDLRLVVGDEGVTVNVEDKPVTVRWADTVAALEWTDGARTFYGSDGQRVTFVPWEWHRGPEARQRLERVAPAHLGVPMGDESPWGPPPEQVEPPPNAWAARKPIRPVFAWTLVVLGYLLGAIELAIAAAGPQPATATSEAVTSRDVTLFVIFGVLLLAAAGWGTRHMLRRRRRERLH